MKRMEAAVSKLGKYFFSIPRLSVTLPLTVLIGVLSGILITAIPGGSKLNSTGLFQGTIYGFTVFSIPSFVSASLTSFWKKEDLLDLRRSAFLSLAGELLIIILFFVSILIEAVSPVEVSTRMFIISNALVLALRFIAITAVSGYNLIPVFFLSALQPVLSMAAYQLLTFRPVRVGFNSPLIQGLLAMTVMLIASWSFITLLDTPLKDRYGAGALELLNIALMEIIGGSPGPLESFFESIGETAVLPVIALKVDRGKDVIGVIVPYIHPGPFMHLGSSNLPYLMEEKLKEAGAFDKVTVLHGTVGHEYNLVSSEYIDLIVKEILKESYDAPSDRGSNPFVMKSDSEWIMAQRIGENILLILSRAPDETEDIDLALGVTLMEAVKACCGFNLVIPVDAHNSLREEGFLVTMSSEAGFNYRNLAIKAASKLSSNTTMHPLKIGYSEFKPQVDEARGIGPAGLKLLSLETGGTKTAYLVIDCNNMIPEVRVKCIERLRKVGYDYAEVLSTDTHSVNKVTLGLNQLGLKISPEIIAEWAGDLGREAMRDLKPAVVSGKILWVKVKVFGSSMPGFLTLVRSTAALSKVAAPTIFIAAIAIIAATLLL